jgi:hypothetical protein
LSLSERLAEAAVTRRVDVWADSVAPEGWEALEPGMPAPCPACDGPGFLDLIDVRRRRQHERCTACGTSWVRPI